jgi:hypothetical protein
MLNSLSTVGRIFKPLPRTLDTLYGREEPKEHIIRSLQDARPRIAILGAAGIGKTTLAVSVMHHPEVSVRYQNRCFVKCEAATTLPLLLSEVADALEIPVAQRNEKILQSILSALNATPTLLCFDNFETPWESTECRALIDRDFLDHINNLQSLAIIMTMRGIQRPTAITWSDPLLPPLQELSPRDREALFLSIAKQLDEFAIKLLNEIGGVPLAVTLLASLIRDGEETTEGLWDRWEEEKTSLVDLNITPSRMSSLDFSIRLSITSSRIASYPPALDVLAMLAQLPRGFPEALNSSLRRSLITQLSSSEKILFAKAAQILKSVALAYRDDAKNRLRFFLPSGTIVYPISLSKSPLLRH